MSFSRNGGRAVAFVISSWAASAVAAEYYVAPGGDDAADGSRARPFHAIQRAADLVVAGDVVHVAPGDYDGFVVEDKRGTKDAPIVFRGEPGARVVRPGPIPKNPPLNTAFGNHQWIVWPHGIAVERSWGVVIEGFEVIGMPEAVKGVQRGGAGIRLEECRGVTVRHNRTDDNGRWGIFSTFCDDLVIEDNEASRSHMEHGIYVSNSGDRPIVRRNYAWGNSDCGIQLNGDNDWDDPVYRQWAIPDGVIQNARIEGNVVRDNGKSGGAAINLDGVVDSVISGNVLEGNHASGIALFQEDGRTASQRDWVIGNFIDMAADAKSAIQIAGCEPGNTANGLCVDANDPYLPEWKRPTAYATPSSGHVILFNTLVQRNPLASAIHTDAQSLAPDAVSRVATISDFNRVTPRFGIDLRLLDLATWQKETGRDLHSRALAALPPAPAPAAPGGDAHPLDLAAGEASAFGDGALASAGASSGCAIAARGSRGPSAIGAAALACVAALAARRRRRAA